MVCILLMGFLCTAGPARADEQASPAVPAAPAEDKLTGSAGVDVLSQYIWRGYALSAHSAVFQPSTTLAYKGFSFNAWGNFDTNQALFRPGAKWNETDFTGTYTRELFKNFNAFVGSIYYNLYNARFDALEVFGGASYAFPWVTVAFTAYREVTHTPGWWLQLDVSRNFELPWYGMNVDLGMSFGYQALLDEDTLLDTSGRLGSYSAFHSGTLNAALHIPVYKWMTITPKIGFAFPLTGEAADIIEATSWDGQSTHVFGGVNVTASF
jgi:hypothetical protein